MTKGLLVTARALLFVGASAQALFAAYVGFITFQEQDYVMFIVCLFGLFGAFIGFVSLRDSLRGRTHAAFKAGLVSSLAPPLNVFTLAGAVLVKFAG